MERTLVLIKPDGVQRGLIGEVITRFERKGLKLVGLKMMSVSDALLYEHYAHHVDKPFFAGVKKFMKKSPIVAMVWEGFECVEAVRILAGATKGRIADAGTIRGDLSMSVQQNIVHASDSVENAKDEVKRFFDDNELFEYEKSEYEHLYADDEL